MAALQSGAADAALLTTPYNFHAEAAGYTNLGLTAETVDLPFSGVSHQPQLGGGHMRTMQKYLAAYTRAILWLEQPANRQAAVDHDDRGEQPQSRRRSRRLMIFLHRRAFFRDHRAHFPGAGSAASSTALKELGDIAGRDPGGTAGSCPAWRR